MLLVEIPQSLLKNELLKMDKLDLTTIILTYNEELHIRRCLENVCPFSKKVYVIDSPSTDRTAEICREFPNVEVVVHQYPGNQAEQFNWALDNCEIGTEWVLRLDADEYCTHELIREMQEKLPALPNEVSAVVLPLGRVFRGRLLKHSIVNGVKMIRLFRYGRVRYEQRLMDEHLEVLEGGTVAFDNMFVDDNLMSIRGFIDKHNNYSSREAALLLDAEFELCPIDDRENDTAYAKDVATKRAQKARYAKMPLYWRSLAYFFYRYVVKLGFLDGRAGFEWDFFQGLWYRLLVDSKVAEVRRFVKSNNIATITDEGKHRIMEYMKRNWNVSL